MIVRQGKPEEIIPNLLKTLNLGPDVAVMFDKEVSAEEVISTDTIIFFVNKTCFVITETFLIGKNYKAEIISEKFQESDLCRYVYRR